MEALGAPSTFRLLFFLGSPPKTVAFRRLPPASAPFRRPPRPHLPYTPSRRLAASPDSAAAGPPTPPESFEDESRAILRDFLTKHEMGCDLMEGRAAALDEIAELLSSKLRSLHESEQLLGIELAEPQLMDLFTPYVRSLLNKYGIVGGDEKLPSNAPSGEGASGEAPSVYVRYKRKLIAQVEMQLSEGCPSPQVLHLMNVGLDLHQILSMGRKHRILASRTIKQKLDRLIEFLIGHGVSESHVPVILHRCPFLLSLNIESTIMPLMAFLESNGVDKEKWPKIIYNDPKVFTISKAKVQAVVGYFSEMGLSAADMGRIMTQSTRLLSRNIDKIKLVNSFFLDNGYTMKEVLALVNSTQGNIYSRSLERNLKPKWEFFVTMGYLRSDLLKYPWYFSLNLEKRIKPRYKRVTELGIRWSMSMLFCPSNSQFEKMIERKMRDGCD